MRGDLEFMSVPRLVRTAAARYADREAVVEGRTRIGFAQLAGRVEQAAAGCLAAGVEAGDRVAVWAPNTLDWIVASLGAVSAGAVLVPVNTRLKGAEAVEVLARTRARLLFVTGTFLGTSYVAALRRAAGRAAGQGSEGGSGPVRGPLPGLPELREVVVLADDAPAEFRTWKEFLAAGESQPGWAVRARANAVGPDAPSDIMFTSGTTGEPKGVVVTHAQTLRAFGAWCDLAGLRRGDRYLIVSPFSHTFGYKAGVLACLMRGATMVPQSVFAADTVLANATTERISVLPGPPTLLQALLDHPGRAAHDLSPLRLVVTGAAVVDGKLVERLRSELGVPTVLTAYGMSEATGVITMCRRGDPPEAVAASSGRALPDTEVTVVGADGKALPPGEPGEVLVRGFQVMAGYFEDPEATARAVDEDGWLHTGDVGVLDADGYLRITDRVKDMFLVGGFNVYPAEVERLLARHPGIAEVAVVGVPDGRLGEVGKAFVVRGRDAGALTEDAVIGWARREMANYKVPRTVEFVTALPRNASGKVLKRALREGGDGAG
ncbi:AMP-binding protein [Streptomyces albireticuli]|uniref:Fatty acid--CoA ligase n=1 Tax=Streptomyces albireticuli TaxID=1940 RepID=A0A2A2D9L7_9ACTN|nr:AMP-binding protein [Streptomyces albireticuli]MCD9144625.1 AMP-binding protein [Streptomyces albireticuli]MCD9165373.1 AMP-binding protein [Streptomyces albireticuli]MCD9193532.1 AMP-binding protein [Streptomyces albireticuli]PAU48215.1 fatty acid--CoA ligase [Streptomyces albireticuli]